MSLGRVAMLLLDKYYTFIAAPGKLPLIPCAKAALAFVLVCVVVFLRAIITYFVGITTSMVCVCVCVWCLLNGNTITR